LLLFLTVIAHQPYSELANIPIPIALKMERRFFAILDNLFKQFKGIAPKDAKKIIESLEPPSQWVK